MKIVSSEYSVIYIDYIPKVKSNISELLNCEMEAIRQQRSYAPQDQLGIQKAYHYLIKP